MGYAVGWVLLLALTGWAAYDAARRGRSWYGWSRLVFFHWCPVIVQLNPYNQLRPQEFSRIWRGDDIASAEAFSGRSAGPARMRACCQAAPGGAAIDCSSAVQ